MRLRESGLPSSSKYSSGAGSGRTSLSAFLRALSEVGEDALRRRRRIGYRCGMAGGLFLGQALRRARAERIEHDAFLYHYRERIPFRYLGDFKGLRAYELSSASAQVRVALVTRLSYARLVGRDCVHFGIGGDADLKCALEKAAREHDLMLPRLMGVQERGGASRPEKDPHFAAAFDGRNVRIFQSLCQEGLDEPTPGRAAVEPQWNEELLESPVRLLRFARVSSEDLIPMQFGVPERNSQDQDGADSELYHPFW